MARFAILIFSLTAFGISACITTVNTQPLSGDEAGAVIEASGIVTAIVPTLLPTETQPEEARLSFESQVSFFFWMAIGERYLTFNGEGDMQLLTEMAGTVRLIGDEK